MPKDTLYLHVQIWIQGDCQKRDQLEKMSKTHCASSFLLARDVDLRRWTIQDPYQCTITIQLLILRKWSRRNGYIHHCLRLSRHLQTQKSRNFHAPMTNAFKTECIEVVREMTENIVLRLASL